METGPTGWGKVWEVVSGGGKPGPFAAYMPALSVAVSAGLKGAGLLEQGRGGVLAASRSKQAAEFSAQQREINAGQAIAAGQRRQLLKGLEGKRLMSAIQARAGAGTTDPTVLNILAQADAARSYAIQLEGYQAADTARTMKMQAAATRYQADLNLQGAREAEKGYKYAAFGALAEGSSLFQKYWPHGGKEDPLGEGAAEDEYSFTYDDAFSVDEE
jgi:hypothetical protein